MPLRYYTISWVCLWTGTKSKCSLATYLHLIEDDTDCLRVYLHSCVDYKVRVLLLLSPWSQCWLLSQEWVRPNDALDFVETTLSVCTVFLCWEAWSGLRFDWVKQNTSWIFNVWTHWTRQCDEWYLYVSPNPHHLSCVLWLWVWVCCPVNTMAHCTKLGVKWMFLFFLCQGNKVQPPNFAVQDCGALGAHDGLNAVWTLCDILWILMQSPVTETGFCQGHGEKIHFWTGSQMDFN